MYNNNQNQYYDERLADSLLKACKNGTADFLNPPPFPYYTQDMLTSQVLRGPSQLQTLLHNAAHGYQYINYAPTYLINNTRKLWPQNLKRNTGETGCIVYKGRDENGNKRYEMMSPAKRFNPNGINESMMNQSPVPNIGIYRQTPVLNSRDPNGMEKYITAVIANYFNAAFTKTPYFPPQWGSQENDMLERAIQADPSMALRASQNAFSQANSVRLDNAINPELNNNVMEAIKQGLPPFFSRGQEAMIGQVNGFPSNGIDFANAIYNNSFNNNMQTAGSGENSLQNGYIPFQTNYEKPKNMDRFLVEQYGNMINASLTGTPYTGCISPGELKNLAAGVQKKMSEEPDYISRIVNHAQQNVMGFNYMPYDKAGFINKARDFSSVEFKTLNKAITDHVKNLSKNVKASFNNEFKKLSKELVEKVKNMDTEKKQTAAAAKTPANKTTANKTTAASKTTASKTPAASKTTASKTAGASKTTAGKTTASKTAGASKTTGKTADNTTPDNTTAVNTASANTTPDNTTAVNTASANTTAANTTAVNTTSANTAAANTTASEKKEAAVTNNMTVDKNERPSFVTEVTEFVKRNIVEKNPALVLADTFLGTVVNKAKAIVHTGQNAAVAFAIANKMSPGNTVSIKLNNDNSRSIEVDKAKKTIQHKPPARSPARR
jgi:hypothetical protein